MNAIGIETEADAAELHDRSPGLFGIGSPKRPDSRKTVTFGDSAAVRSLPFWSLVSLVLIVIFWYISTKAWGFPQEFVASAKASAADDGIRFTHKDMLTQCKAADGCDESMYTQWLNPRRVPSPHDTWQGFKTLATDGFKNISLWEHTWASLWRVIRGMFFGVLAGVPIGIAMGLSSRLRGFFDTIVETLRPIPPLAILPLFIIWFGIGDSSAYKLLVFASIWIMIIAARSGVRTVNLSKIRAAYSLGASKRQVLMRVILPNALPELFTGMRVALGVSWGTLVAAELVGTDTGLGSMIFQARAFFRLDIMFVGVIIIAIIGVLMDIVMRYLESKLIPWRGKG